MFTDYYFSLNNSKDVKLNINDAMSMCIPIVCTLQILLSNSSLVYKTVKVFLKKKTTKWREIAFRYLELVDDFSFTFDIIRNISFLCTSVVIISYGWIKLRIFRIYREVDVKEYAICTSI